MASIPHSKLIQIYTNMLRIRKFEQEIARRWPEQEMRSPPHFYTGQEAVASAVCATLEPQDKIFGYYRGHGYYLAKGGDSKAFIAEMYCKVTGANEGKGGSMLLSAPNVGYVGSSALVAGTIPIATGLALANKMSSSLFPDKRKKTPEVVVDFFGDGATEEGVFFESLNFASLKKLPIIYVCENNFYAVTTHIKNRQARPENIYKHAQSFGIESVKIDGYDPELIYQTAQAYVDRVRKGQGPFFIEAITYRWFEHVGEKLDDKYGLRTKEELDNWIKKDPVALLHKKLIKEKVIQPEALEKIAQEIDQEVAEAFKFGISAPLPKENDLIKNVYA